MLSGEVVETSVPAYTFREFLAHQLRWARTVRDARPPGYFGMIFTLVGMGASECDCIRGESGEPRSVEHCCRGPGFRGAAYRR